MIPEFLLHSWLGQPAWMWLGFLIAVLVLLVLDLGVMHRKNVDVSVRDSMKMCAFYVALGMAFAGVIYWLYGRAGGTSLDEHLNIADNSTRAAQAVQLYLTGYLVELSLSMDNVFVISLIFGYFAIPNKYQHRVLFWGIIGVITFRAIMIGVGAALVTQFAWILVVFAIFLLFTGIKMLTMADKEHDLSHNSLLLWLRGHLRITPELHGEKFFVLQPDANGKMLRYATPAFVALIMIEVADVVFAVDSVPAIFAITKDPYIVYTSNIFAILGLRSLYFTLAAMVHRFAYLKYALALVLVFIGGKILYTELTHDKFPALLSLLITLLLLVGGVVFSLWKTRGQAGAPPA